MLVKRDVQVLVSGAGPVGLVTALFLNRRGVRVAVLDEQMRTAARSYACAVHPQTLELLDEIGVADELIARGQRVDTFAYYDGAERKLELRYAQLGGRFPFLLVVPQPLLEDALERRLASEGVPVECVPPAGEGRGRAGQGPGAGAQARATAPSATAWRARPGP
jgi:NADPH-dependent dioxygenase